MGEVTTAVLIVGAGPTGLTLACQLARCGVLFEIIEASPGPHAGSRGKGLQPRSLEVLEDLGVVEAVLSDAQVMPMLAIAPDGSTSRVDEVPQSLLGRSDIPYPASVITPEWRVEGALRDLLGGLGHTVRFGTTFDSCAEQSDGIIATVSSGGGTGTIRARWLVGCDGGHSVIRKQSGIAFVGETRDDVRMLVADVRVDGLDRGSWYMWRSEGEMASLCPLPSTDLFQFQAGIEPGVEPDLSVQNLQAVLDRVSGRGDVRIVDAPWTSVWLANTRLAERYRHGRVFLAGDAAHIHPPAGGQGMNTGIQDATNLGWKLTAVEAGASANLLATYEAERRPVAERVLSMSNRRMNAVIRDKALPASRDSSTIQLDISYRDSPLARDDRNGQGVLRAGDRAPDATGLTARDGSVHRLFELTAGGTWTLLPFGGAPLGAVDGVTVIDVDDSDGSLAAAYGATDGTLVLIRPDGYVALISDAGEMGAVGAYLDDLRAGILA
ncbi:2-polyprenyl-6-methoxyphenol hydroxylase-like FAD-dependent oxidoreductase [Curtobacterium sp. 320]|jgi:2-polyprenyl-6-methoxyphenol hydroxylase-like FAD-dependent oxidoreductase|uniref:FAD-dependent monooxygenase n=2 Tax=unclassified Curtobacterium TaxID=257496 RepID=UPI0028673F71|nr:FAD-dependent monooxygenase [Curtobacterium sp. 320]MDR6573583.1 2-polyprenyl-6-methoxyphenol hydroxylase-like FAD-dependent oxidoreductase [Curtobacterium sp. 320]